MSEATGWSPGTRDTVIDVMARAIENWPDAPFLDFDGVRHSYRDIDQRSTRFAHALAELGLRAGETFVSMLDNNVDAIVAWIAANKLGAIWVPVNTAYKGEFLRHLVSNSGASLLLCEAAYAPRVAAVSSEIPELRRVLYRGSIEAPLDAAIAFEPLDDHRGTDGAPLGHRPDPSDISLIIYTGGTTGPSKGCMISHNACCAQAYNTLRLSERTADEIHFTALPMFHLNSVAHTILASAIIGGMAAIGSRFSVSGFWPEIERTGARIATLLGAMPAMVASAPDNPAMERCHGQLRMIRGAPFPPAVHETFRTRFGVRYPGSNVYGMTEVSPVTCVALGEEGKPGSSGKPNPDFHFMLVDDDGNVCPSGTAGEIWIRPKKPDIIFSGYWRQPEETLKIVKDLWFHTGDIGRLDEDGYFYFVDRKKDYMRRRGENISSYELETAFSKHPAIQEVAAHAVYSELGEDDVKITCILNDDATLSEEELCRWSIAELPYFAVPRYIEFRRELPRNPVGRVLKYQLRDEGKTATTWDREAAGLQFERR
ncbi:MAG: AMP-binding protein [Sphingobium sp.]